MPPDHERRLRFESLVAEVHDPLARYLARRMPADSADEVMNDVLLVLWRRLDSVPEPAPLPWCYAVARRGLANHRRGDQRRLALVQKLEAQLQPIATPSGADDHPELALALDSLGPADLEVIRLWAWEGLEPREIAQVLGTTANAVSIRLTRIRAYLGRHMARKDSPTAGHNSSEDTGDPR